MSSKSTKIPKPFLKWAGGKTQLLNDINNHLPIDLSDEYKYFEPFVGGGAVFFNLVQQGYKFKKVYLGDINKDLILTYNVIKKEPDVLISILDAYERNYKYEDVDNKKLFYTTRVLFNEFDGELDPFEISIKNIFRAAQMIFLNKTCFNGLYRVNKSGKFNVPFANPKNPLICYKNNIYEVSDALKNVEFIVGDFLKCEVKIDNKSFVYLDPPYKPINGNKSFEGYTKDGFDDSDQERLSEFCKRISSEKINAKFLLSNSKPKNNYLFDKFYKKDFVMDEVSAKRAINSNGKKRGDVEELLIYNNYDIQ